MTLLEGQKELSHPSVGDWPRGDFLGVPLDGLTVEQFMALMVRRVEENPEGPALAVGYLNAANSNLAAKDAAVASFLRDVASVVYADGMGVVWGARRLGLACPERVNAGDFLPELLGSFSRPIRLALVGGWEGLAEKAGAVFLKSSPAGSTLWTRHGYGLESDETRRALREELRNFGPDLLLLGMGAPRQEALATWLLQGESPAPVIWCVGALFEYFAGERYRAPTWARRAGLEWAVRLILEPRRLWKRYLIGNAIFAGRVERQRWRQ
jgi:N-acetylglucosaminyldiphosphoundecaprenol N-acetyl-beta-D-mannosaminyltransferase